MARQHQRLSMLRSYRAADLFTLANASCGTLAVFACLGYLAVDPPGALWPAFALPILALVCDVLDGYVARLDRSRQSQLGADLDSLADVVSFGVAPAVLAFTLGLRGGWDVAVLTFFVCCGISRLARFNVTAAELTSAETGKVRYFEGTPIPTSIVLVVTLAVVYYGGLADMVLRGPGWSVLGWDLHAFSVLYFLNGSLMISTIRVPKL